MQSDLGEINIKEDHKIENKEERVQIEKQKSDIEEKRIIKEIFGFRKSKKKKIILLGEK